MYQSIKTHSYSTILYKQRVEEKKATNWVFAPPPLIAILTKFGMWGGLLNMILKLEFQDNRSINFGAACGGVEISILP